MSIISLTLETVTSLFMHGADSRSRAELRPPAIKGLMRFWFRALAGGAADLVTVRKMETQVFGSSDAGQGITVRVESPVPSAGFKPFLLPHKPDCTNNPSQIDRLRSPSPALKEGEEFNIFLFNQFGRDPKLLKIAIWALWLSTNLGGFGQRARRGAGSLALREVAPPIPDMPMAEKFAAPEEVKEYLETGLRNAKACFRETFSLDETKVPYSDLPPFPILARDVACIQVLELQLRDEEAARAEIMRKIARFKNLAWGLPYGRPAQGENGVMRRRIGTHPNGQPRFEAARMASPVWIHIMPKKNEGYFLVQTLMKSRFPDGLEERRPDWEKIAQYFRTNAHEGALAVNLP